MWDRLALLGQTARIQSFWRNVASLSHTVRPCALSRLAAFSALAADQFLDPVVNLVSDCSHCIERLPLRVWKRPVNRPQIGNERTGFSATHCHKDGSGSGEVFGQPPRSRRTQIDTDLPHDFHYF